MLIGCLFLQPEAAPAPAPLKPALKKKKQGEPSEDAKKSPPQKPAAPPVDEAGVPVETGAKVEENIAKEAVVDEKVRGVCKVKR